MDPMLANMLMDILELMTDMNDAKIDDDFLTTPAPGRLIHDRIEIVRGRLGAYIKDQTGEGGDPRSQSLHGA